MRDLTKLTLSAARDALHKKDISAAELTEALATRAITVKLICRSHLIILAS